MIFSAVEFVFVFLPAAYAVLFLVARWFGRTAAILWLALASLVFYGWWDWRYVGLILASIAVNYLLSIVIRDSRAAEPRRARLVLALGIALNVAALAYFKYFNFVAEAVLSMLGSGFEFEKILLPLAISFFTFQQIAYLVDTYRGEANVPRFVDYTLFVTFFPQLIIGPIVKYAEVLPQFARPEVFRFDAARLATGLSIFLIGLAKKVLVADPLSAYSDLLFFGAEHGGQISFYAAWFGVLCFTVQLYFDFSGYADMAVGLAAMIGIALPVNFNSPYKSKSIVEFWHRWHITLSRFLRVYVYYPMGGRSRRLPVRYLCMFATMFISGIWHGAGWNFVIWGAIHGAILVAGHAWHRLRTTLRPLGVLDRVSWLWHPAGIAATLFAFAVTLVLFRAQTFSGASQIYAGMLGANGFFLPSELVNLVPGLERIADPMPIVPFFPVGTVVDAAVALSLTLGGLAIALFCPNVYEMRFRWRLAVLAAVGFFALQKVLFGGQASPFVYFQF